MRNNFFGRPPEFHNLNLARATHLSLVTAVYFRFCLFESIQANNEVRNAKRRGYGATTIPRGLLPMFCLRGLLWFKWKEKMLVFCYKISWQTARICRNFDSDAACILKFFCVKFAQLAGHRIHIFFKIQGMTLKSKKDNS